MSRSFSFVGLLVIVGLCGVRSADAATLTSALFSFGYGYTPAASWNTSETAGFNTPTVQGDFTFAPSVTGGGFDGTGPVFTGRVLGDGGGDYIATSMAYGSTPGLLASIAAAYSGPAPLDAAPIPNYQIQLNISQISIYGANYGSYGALTLAFTETTAGHGSISPSIPLPTSTPVQLASQLSQLVWNPADYAENGTSFTRTFGLLSENISPVDGFEVFGTVTLTYDAVFVPEPSTFALLGFGAIGLAVKTRRRRAAA